MRYLLLTLFCLGASQARAQDSFKSFVSTYLVKSRDIAIAQNKAKSADENLSVIDSANTLTLHGLPVYQSSLDGEETKSHIESQLTQKLKTGTDFNLMYQKNGEKDGFGNNLSQQNLALSVVQSVGKNRLGKLQNLYRSEGQENRAQAQQQVENAKLQQCLKGAELYSELYYRNERLKIAKRLHQEAQKILEHSEKNYQQQLIDRISLLSAEANEIRNQSLVDLENVAMAKLAIQTKVFLDMPSLALTQNPDAYLFHPESEWDQSVKSFREMIIANDIEVNKISQEILTEESKPQVDLSFEIGSNDYSGFAVDPGLNRYVQAGINFVIPIKDHANYHKKNILGLQIVENQLEMGQVRDEKEVFFRQYEKEVEYAKKQLKLSQQKIDLYRQQMEDGYKQYQNNKIEFETFLDFQNRLLNELMNKWEIKKSIWLLNLTAYSWSSHFPQFCQEG